MTALRFLGFVLLAQLGVLASNPHAAARALPKQAATPKSNRGETELLKSIVLITIEAKEPDKAGKPGKVVTVSGTGFLVGVRDSRLKDLSFTYLVTNRHVAEAFEQDEKGNCGRLQIQKTYVTLNLKEPINGNRSDQVDISNSKQFHWYFPKDEASDLAVMPFGPPDKYDFRLIDSTMLLSTDVIDKQQVVPGDKVLTGGYFYHYAGLHEFQPIIREGVLAMMPDGPMPTTTCKSGNVFLVDVHVIRGNSGSPIFIVPALGLQSAASFGGVPSVFGLLGVVSGYMYESEGLTLRASTTWTGSANANSGISVVVPAQQLKDLLEGPELQAIRDVDAPQINKIRR